MSGLVWSADLLIEALRMGGIKHFFANFGNDHPLSHPSLDAMSLELPGVRP